VRKALSYAEAHAQRKPKNARKRITARRVTRGGRNSDPDKLVWIRTLRCVVGVFCSGRVEAHHVRVRGSRATDRLVAPACYRHHHEMTPAQVATIYGVDWLCEAEEYERQWQARKASGVA